MGTPLLPSWAPRVSKLKIHKLYQLDASGIYDDELLNDVGWAFFARCLSFIEAVDAVQGKVHCPSCGEIIFHQGQKEEILTCMCGWTLSWSNYFTTIQHKQLSGAEPVLNLFREFVAIFPKVKNNREKMITIDRLIHGFHYYYKDNTPTRPVAVNLIEGKLSEVMAFLDELSYGEMSTPGIKDVKHSWDENIKYARSWGKTKTD
jgi:hypothetical protein